MARYTYGVSERALDPWGINTKQSATVVEADCYRISEGFVTFELNGEDIVSVPAAGVQIVSKLDANDQPMVGAIALN